MSSDEATAIFSVGVANFFQMNSRNAAEKIKRELGWSPDITHDILTDIATGSYHQQ